MSLNLGRASFLAPFFLRLFFKTPPDMASKKNQEASRSAYIGSEKLSATLHTRRGRGGSREKSATELRFGFDQFSLNLVSPTASRLHLW